MSSTTRNLIILVAAGIGIAVAIGLLGARGGGSTSAEAQAQEQAQGQAAFCSSLAGLRSAVGTLNDLDASTASKSEYQTAVAAVQTAWAQVAAEAKTVSQNSLSALDTAWDNFDAAVQAVPSSDSAGASIEAVSTQAQALATAVQTTSGSLQC